MITGRELFTKFLNDEPLPRPAFVPMIRGLLCRVGGIPMQTLMNDPTLWANSLVKTHKLFRFDGIVVGLDFTLMAEACGCEIVWEDDRPKILCFNGGKGNPPETGRMRHALETARRVFDISRQEQACIATMTGPVTLANYLFGDKKGPDHIGDVKQMVVQVAEAFCKTGPDVLIFLEREPLAAVQNITMVHRKIYNTLKNIAEYYNVRTGLYLQGYRPENVDAFRALRMDLYVLGPSFDMALPPVSRVWDLGVGTLGVGLGLPLTEPAMAQKIIKEGRELYKTTGGRGVFFTSFGPVTRDVDLETLHELVNEIFNL
jgi:hypothetical protein